MILVTGGAGYIGSHCVVKLLEEGYQIVIFDNLSTGHKEIIERLKSLKLKGKIIDFFEGDLRNIAEVETLFHKYQFDTVFHFAALSQVGESVKFPYKYFQNNVVGSNNLFETMAKYGCKKIIFSSTASVYGNPQYVPIDENHPKNPINPYGQTKLTIESLLNDFDKKYGIKSVILRYFNVAGADEQGRTGEWHTPETHLIPNILKADKNQEFCLFGNDYDTPDGTCVRDYIDVNDLIEAHFLAMKYLETNKESNIFNLGTKLGNSVSEIFTLCEEITGRKIPLKICPRREGDPASLVADSCKAKKYLQWKNKHSVKDSITTAKNWHDKLKELKYL